MENSDLFSEDQSIKLWLCHLLAVILAVELWWTQTHVSLRLWQLKLISQTLSSYRIWQWKKKNWKYWTKEDYLDEHSASITLLFAFQSKLSSWNLPNIKFKLSLADCFGLQEIFLWNNSKEEMNIYCLENINSNLNS